MSNKTEDKIIEAATDLFSKYSFYGVSMRRIALAGSVNKATVYYYFRNKENLYSEVLRNMIRKLRKSLGNLSETNKSLEIKVDKNRDRISQFYIKNQDLLRLLIYELNSGGKYLFRVLNGSGEKILRTFLADELSISIWNSYLNEKEKSYSGLNDKDIMTWISIHLILDSILKLILQTRDLYTTQNNKLDKYIKIKYQELCKLI